MSDPKNSLDAGLFEVGDVTALSLMLQAGKVIWQAWYLFGPETTYADWEAVITALAKGKHIPLEVVHLKRQEVSFACRPECMPNKAEVDRSCAELQVRKLTKTPMRTVDEAALDNQSVPRLTLP